MGIKEDEQYACLALEPVKIDRHAPEGRDPIYKHLLVGPQPSAARQEGRQKGF